ncbi:hypothetical protein GLOIN_2v1476024 [Rhizophagus irregularis DAOM 181602=DAOM 197198]|nr:hypothetical protein GLOIN_2v1476024 [Rhizophagus irregularis DAOM 181602=DAOM 197198]
MENIGSYFKNCFEKQSVTTKLIQYQLKFNTMIMMLKISTICYIHDSIEPQRVHITAVSRLGINNPTKIVYLKIKAFVPSDRNIETQKSKILKGLDTYY